MDEKAEGDIHFVCWALGWLRPALCTVPGRWRASVAGGENVSGSPLIQGPWPCFVRAPVVEGRLPSVEDTVPIRTTILDPRR